MSRLFEIYQLDCFNELLPFLLVTEYLYGYNRNDTHYTISIVMVQNLVRISPNSQMVWRRRRNKNVWNGGKKMFLFSVFVQYHNKLDDPQYKLSAFSTLVIDTNYVILFASNFDNESINFPFKNYWNGNNNCTLYRYSNMSIEHGPWNIEHASSFHNSNLEK